MKLRHLQLAIVVQLICTIATEDDRSYDTNDWIPVTQNSGDVTTQKKATARVLNLDSPSQKFFPDELNYKKSRPNFQSRPKQKDRYNVPKYESTYKFELPPSLPQTGSPKFQYYPKQGAQLPNYQQSPSLEVYRPPPIQQYIQNPSSNIPNNFQQFTIPFNSTSYYQTISPVSINQELSGNGQGTIVQYQSPSGVGIQYQHPGTVVNQNNKILYQNSNSATGIQSAFSNNNGAVHHNSHASGNTQAPVQVEKESVQLVYVPLENLKENGQPVPQDSQTIYKQVESPKYENLLDKQHRLEVIEQDFIQQALQATKLQEQIQHGDPLLFQISTTPKPIKKRKPHQPPLAVYVEGENKNVALSDVLEALKNANTISVQDSIQSDSPQIFIGPSTLESPEYFKFPLPYLNGIDGNRLNRNIENLPFFVAPLSFKTPPGFSKIPLPAPHVGSVVISNKEELHDKRSTPKPNQFNDPNIKQIIKEVSSTTPKSKYNSLNIQPYIGQSYYEPVQFVPSPQPQLLQFAVNDKQQEYSLPHYGYDKKSEKNGYNQPAKAQSNIEEEVVTNTKNPTNPSFQYAYIDEIATGTTPTSNSNTYSQIRSSENDDYSVSNRNPTYTSPQAQFNQEERIKTPAYQQQYTDNKSNQNKIVDTIGYEPISTTFEDASRSQQEEIVNIKPKTETVTRQKTPTYPNENQQKGRLPDVNPLELAINEFELHEINTQLEEKPRIKNQNNFKDNPTQNDENVDYRYQNNYKPKHVRNQNKQRLRPNQNDEDTEYRFDPELHRFSSTPLSILRDSYIETTTRPVTKQRGRVRTRPTTVTTTTTTPQPDEHYTVLEEFYVRDKSTPQYTKPSSVHYSDQTDHQIDPVPNKKSSDATQYADSITEIENIPTNVYSLNPKQNVYTEKNPIEHSHILNQNLMDRQILNSNSRPNSDQYEKQGQFEVVPHTSQYTPVAQEEYKDEEQIQPLQYTNPFEDPSVRSLLIPNLLVPTTTGSIYTGPSYLPTTEKIIPTTTTEKPVETTTTPHSRIRSRTRGGNRYSESSTTKKPVSRRRPTNPRVTTERIRYPVEVEYSTRSSSTNQRFRSRSTTPNSITERLSTTENEAPVPSSDTPSSLRTHPDGSESYMQYEQIVEQKSEEPAPTVDYPKYHITSTRPILQYENTASSPKPVLNVQVTHPVESYQYEHEEIPKFKVRSRIRDKTKSTSTTTEKVTRRVTSPKPIEKEETSDEFFGFFRQPNFGAPLNSNKEEIITTPAPSRIFTYQTPSQHREDYNIDSSTVRFVGEIVPKYTSREVETETPKPRIRARTKPNVRKPASHQDRLEQTTKRSAVVRSRGKTHYRAPETLKKNVDEEAEVEGGNYPQFFQERRVTTVRPEFQITVAPEEDEDDQAPHSSINRPNVVASPDEWHDASILDHISDDKTQGNVIDKQGNQSSDILFPEQPASPDQPYALPVRSSSEESGTDSSDERFRKTSKQIEEQFEAINNFNDQAGKEEDKKKKRKGVWKLVKQRPVDRLETSESQNYFSVLNSYHDIRKVNGVQERDNYQNLNHESVTNPEYKTENYSADTNMKIRTEAEDPNNNVTLVIDPQDKKESFSTEVPVNIDKESVTEEVDQETTVENFNTEYVNDYEKFSTITPAPITDYTTKGEDFLDSIYEMFGMSRDITTQEVPVTSTVTEIDSEPTVTTTSNPTFPEELTETSTTAVNVTEPSTETTTLQDFLTSLPVMEKKQENKMLPFQIEPWDMKLVRTSTSTEVSHETEICYRGRCVRSPDRKKRFQ